MTNNGSSVTAQGWQYSSNNSSWNTFDPVTALPYSYNGYYLRYYATNAGGTTYSNTVQMTVNPLPVISSVTSNVTNNTICGEGNSATLTANSSNATSYSWSNGAGSGASVTVAPTSATTYTVTAAIGSCTATSQISIDVVKAPVITATPANTECITAGTQVTLKGGISLTDYEFSTGTSSSEWYTLTNTTNIMDGGTTTGDYALSTVHDIGFTFPFAGNTYTQFSVNSDGNLRLGSTVTGTGNYSTPFSSSNASSNNPKINGMGFDGFFDVSSYGNYVRMQVFGTSPNRVLVVEFKESPYSSSYRQYPWRWQVQLSENGTVQIVYASSSPSSYGVANQIGLCVDASDGWTISTTAHTATHFTNGTSTTNATTSSWPGANRYYRFTPPPTPTYAWSYSGTTGTASGSNYTVSPTALSSTYTLSATLNGCTLTDSKTVTTVPTLSNITSNAASNTICNGSSATLSASSNASSLSWNNGAGNGASVTASPSATTSYTVTASANGCTNTGSITITVNDVPTLTAISAPAAICAGNTLTLTAPTVTANGSTVTAQGWQYSANGSSNWNTFSTSTQVPYSYNGYYLRYYATNGCGTTYSNTVKMTVNDQPVISSVTSNVANNTICGEGNSATLTANSSNATSYSWSNGAGSGASVTVAPTSATTYTVTAAIGSCTTTGQIAIEVMKAPVITSTPASTECIAAGTQVTLKPSADKYAFNVTSGTYSSISGTSSVSGDDNYSSAVNIGFTFNYWGEDYTTAVISTNGFLKLGNGSNGLGNDLTSTSYYNYLAAFWDDLDANSTQYTTLGTSPNRVFVMQHNGYRHSDNTSNTFTYQIRLYETTNVIEFWYGSGFPSVAYSSTSASIGLNNYENGTNSFISVTPTGIGTATSSTTTSNNSIGTTQCDYLTSGTIYRFTPLPTPTYAWSYNGTAGTASGSKYTVSPTALSSTYTLSATLNGCTLTDSKTVTTTPVLNISSSAGNAAACGGSEVELSATSNASNFTWSDGAGTTATVTVHPEISTIYHVTASSGSCTTEGSVGVTVINNPTVTITPDPAETCIDGTAQMVIKANDNFSSTLADYEFSTGTSSQWLSPSFTTIYSSGQDDEGSSTYNIGFTFNFAGIDYTQFSVNTNGSVRLGASNDGGAHRNTPFSSSNAGSYSPKIIGVGRDLGTGTNGYVKYGVYGTQPNRILVCEFATGNSYSSSLTADVKWQVQLFETSNKVQIVYYSSNPSTVPSSYQIGMCTDATDVITINPSTHTTSTGTTSTTYSSWPGVNRYYRFTPPTPPAFAWSHTGTQGSESTDVITNDTYTVTPAAFRNAYTVTNSATGCSAHVTLDLMDAANITAENVTIDCGNSTTLTASGLDGVTYNWYSDAACSRLIQANNATLSTPVLNDNTTYYVKAVKGENCETQAKAVTVTVNKPSVSITELVDQTICDGESFTFNPQAMGNGELSYHWSNGNTTIGEDPTYAAATAGTYLVTVTSTVGNCSVTENTSATLTVNDIPSLTAITAPAPVHYGSTLSLTAPTVTDNGSTVTAQGWEICATQDGNYTAFDPTTTVGFTQDGYFLRYYATNSCGTTVSNAVQITINKPILTTSVSPSNSGSITCSPMSDGGAYDYGTSVQLTATPSTGYTFQNWTIDGSTVTGNPATITMDADHNVVSNFTLNSHNVTYTYTGTVPTGAPAVPAEATYNYGATVPAAAVPTLTGYTFSGWSGEVATMPDEDVTVTGYWTVNSYTLTVNYNYADNSQAAETHTETVNYGATYSVASPAITGYTPSQATVSGTMPAQNVTVDVTYNVNSYTLTVNYRYAGGTQAAETHTETVNYGATYSVASPAITGYTPDQATVSGTMPAQNVTVDVTYNVNSYTLTVNYRYAGGTQAAETHTEAVNYGATYSVASPAITGYTPSQATVSGTMPAQNVTVDVTYNVNSYTLTVNYVYAGGTQAAETHTETVNYGATYSVVSPAITGYTPDQATVSGTMPAQNVTVDVTYNVNSYTLTVNYRYAGGTQAAATHTETVNYGATYSVASPAITGYTPDQATVSGTMPAQNVTVDVTYNVNSYTIAASANPAAGGSVTGAGTYGPGTTATLTATANNGYIFTNWTEGDEVVSTNATYTISDISSNHVLVAHFGHSMGLTVTGGNWIYNGQARTATVIPEVTEGTTIWYRTSEEDEWSSNVPSITDAGSITVYVKASNPDYADAYANCTLTINAKAVTITVTNASKTYGATDPAFTGTVTGLVNDDDLGDITYSRTGNDENAGTYTAVLTATYTANSNYTVIVTKGKFTINPKAVTITVNNASKAYGANDPAFTGTVEGLVNANDLGNITYSRTNDDENAGTYTGVLTANYTANNNYTVTVNNGNFTITPIEVTVTIVGASNTTDYDGEEHSVSGYTATANSDLYDVDHDFTFSGTAAAARTDAGTNMMGLRANRFTNTNPNFTNVTFEVTDGYITISPIEVTVTIVGYNTTVSYDGAAHSVNDFTVTANSALYDVEEDFTFSGNATATRTDAGTTYMGLNEEQFENNNDNFDVTFAITDGYIIISPATLAITVTGNTDEVVYNGSEQSVTGYRLACTSSLFDESKVVFEGNDEAVGTNVNTYPMGLSADLFSYNDNNINATFSVTDGKLTITQAALTITVTGNSDEVAYNGNEQSVTGYELACESSLYDATKVVFEGDDEAAGTTVGTYPMGLTADMFTYEDDNINATFSVTDGKLTITPAALTITVTGNTDEVAYNGSEQSVTGYTLSCTSNLYDATKVVFEGDDEAAGTNVGEYEMGLTADMFSYNDANIDATFRVTDGKLTITPAALTITVTGNTDEMAYNGSEQSVTGYTLSCTSNLYDATKVVFEGDDEAAGTTIGEYAMGLTTDMFTYEDDNFANVTFNVTDGKLTITSIDVTVTITGANNTVDYDGAAHRVTGYTATANNDLYNVEEDFTFTPAENAILVDEEIAAIRTDAGTTYMGLAANQFANTNTNFNVTFRVTDGYITITPIDVTVTITGANNTVDYDGAAHRITGYTATASNDLYNVEEDFTFTPAENAIIVDEEIAAIRTDAGTTYMGLADNQFANTNTNFAHVTFDVTDGYITITPIDVTVTIVGNNGTADYDGAAHSVSGYTATASSNLYDVDHDFTFSGTATASRTDAGTTNMGLDEEQFENTNTNFANVTFEVTDGYQKINPIDVTVTIVGNNGTADYDGAAHSVSGYTATAGSNLYDVDHDFTFSGTATASRTDAGTTHMGLDEEQFENTNTNFANVTFNVTDGYITINAVDVVVTIVGDYSTEEYDGEEHTVTDYTATANNTLYDVTRDFTFSGTATASRTDAGTTNMGLNAEQFTNTNENFTSVTFNVTDGYITVSKKAATIAAVNNGKVYGDAEPTLTAEVTGAVDGETLNYFVTRATGENVGEYAITVTPGSNPNYDITTTGATFTVTKATATVTANDNSKTYGTANDPALTATVTGLQNGDAASVISYTVSREAGEYVGDYAITPSGAAVQGNYDVEYVAGIFSILPTVEITTTPMPTAICSGSELTVAFDATIAGNNGTMSFAWSRNHTDDVEGTANGTGNINVTLTADATQTVTFTVTPTFTPTEGEAVEGTAITFDVTVNALPSVTEVANNVSCTEMGSAIITVTSEGSTFTCAWNNGAAAALTQQDNNGHYYTSFTNLSEGQFPYAITDANQCVTTGTITIEDPGRIFGTQSIASSTTDETCENIDLEIAINLMGGTPDYTLQWINVDNDEVVTETVTDNRQATLNLGRLPVGEYHLAMFIRDHFGCTGIASDTLTLVVKPIRTIVREVNIGSDDATYVYNGHTYNADEVPPTETYTGANGCDSIISYAVHSYPLDILVADKCTMTRSSYTKAYANNARLIGDTIYVKRNTATTFYAFIENTTANTWNEHKMDMRYELLFNEGTIANAEMPSLVSNFSISTYYDRTGTYYGIDNLTASTGEIPNNTLAFRQTANSTILHYDFFYFDAFKDIPNKVTFTGLQNGTYTFKLKAEDRHSSGGTNRTGIYNPYVVNRKFGHIWGGYNDRPGNREVLAARTFTVIVNETGTAPSHAQACTGISEYSNEPSVTTFPNPVNDQLNIRISGMSGATAITITDAQGRVVRTINTELYGSEEVLTYSVADFAQGIYFLNVRNSDTVVAQKFVVTKR